MDPWGAFVEVGVDCGEGFVGLGCEGDGFAAEGVDDDGYGVGGCGLHGESGGSEVQCWLWLYFLS